MSIDISDKNIRNREKDFLPPAFSKNGPERAGSHPVELFSRTGRTCYGFQILIRSKEEDDDEDLSEDVLADKEDEIQEDDEDEVVRSISEALKKNEDDLEVLDIQDVDDVDDVKRT